MTFREKLADWISGGALSRAYVAAKQWKESWGREFDDHTKTGLKVVEQNIALRRIAAMETPGANATVRRMAETAREARG